MLAADTPDQAPSAASLPGEHAPTWTLLCVDDEPNILSSLRPLFRGSGYRVLTAGSGAEALVSLMGEPIDLVISDMRMDGMDGAQSTADVLPLMPMPETKFTASTAVAATNACDFPISISACNERLGFSDSYRCLYGLQAADLLAPIGI
jgi:CheY-like chemotaxis protein